MPFTLSSETARFLLDLLSRQQLSVGAPDFDQAVALVQHARDELLPFAAEELPPT